MIKYLIVAAVLFVIYIAFFKKTAIKEEKEQKNKDKKNSGDIMIECSECTTFVSESEAIIKDGKFFCSKQCANLR